MDGNSPRSNVLATICAFLALAFFTPDSAFGEETTMPPCVATQDGVHTAAKPTDAPQFYDEPQFTVAGVKDASETGGHGSQITLRATEALTKDAVALHAQTGAAGQTSEASVRAALEHDQGNGALHHNLGDLEEELGHPLPAVQEYQRAAELSASETNLFDWGAELLLHRAYEPASEVFAKGRRLFPASVRMALGLGVAAYARGSYEVAAQRLCEASDLAPGDAKPYLFLGKLQGLEATRIPGVAERLARFARLQPESAWASYYYALSLWQGRDGSAGNTGQAEALLERAVRLDPKLGVAYLQLGILHADRKENHKAIDALQSALRLEPEMEEAHYRLGQIYRTEGDTNKAKQELEVYQRIYKSHEAQAEHDRREIQQFVYAERVRTPAPGPQRN